MSYSHSIPPTIRINRTHLIGIVAAVAALTAAVTWAVSSLAFETGTSGTASSSQATFRVSREQIEGLSTMSPEPATFTTTRKQIEGLSAMAQQTADPPTAMTPAQLAGLGFGTGYQLPSVQNMPTAAAVLASMSPETRRYTESILNLTFEQLAAGGAGHP